MLMPKKTKYTKVKEIQLIMLTRICDQCKESLEKEKYYEINVCEVDKDGWHGSTKSFDLCESCYRAFLDSLKENK